MRSFSRFTFFSTLVLSSLLLSGCKEQAQPVQQAPEVAYVVIQTEPVAVINELSGRLESFRNSDVRARVAGVLEKRLFNEGTDVKQGEKLFIIDPRSHEASVQNARAALARAEANFMQADLKYRRYMPLVKISAVSKQEYDDAMAAQKQAAADVASAKAALVKAKLDLEYSTVLAPISGRIGRAMVTEGALVGQGEVTLLAVIQQIDPIYLNLTQSSTELLQLQQALKKGLLTDAADTGMNVTLIMEDGTPYIHPGKLIFSDITVDPSTGEVSIRALFPNPDATLLPGMYVRGQLKQAINENAITVPKQAVQRATEGSTVFVINKDNAAEVRRVQTGASHENKWVILEGLNVGDKVIVEGIQKVRPGAPVSPVLWEGKAAASAAAADAPAETDKTGKTADDDEKTNPATETSKPEENAPVTDTPKAEEKATTAEPSQSQENTDKQEKTKPAVAPEPEEKTAATDKPVEKPKPVNKSAQVKETPAAAKKEKNRTTPVTAKPAAALQTLPAEKATPVANKGNATQTEAASPAGTETVKTEAASPTGSEKE